MQLGESVDFDETEFHSVPNTQRSQFLSQISSQAYRLDHTESQLPETIPDSQDLSPELVLRTDPAEIFFSERNSLSEIVESDLELAGTGASHSDLPSHQRNVHFESAVNQSSGGLKDEEPNLGGFEPISVSSTPEEHPVVFFPESPPRPSGFLSQAPLLANSARILASSLDTSSRSPEIIIHTTQEPESQSLSISAEQTTRSPPNSQAAQIVLTPFEPSPTKITDSNNTSVDSRLQSGDSQGFKSQLPLADLQIDFDNISEMSDQPKQDASPAQEADELGAVLNLDMVAKDETVVPEETSAEEILAAVSTDAASALSQPLIEITSPLGDTTVTLAGQPTVSAEVALDSILNDDFSTGPVQSIAQSLISQEQSMGTISPSDILAGADILSMAPMEGLAPRALDPMFGKGDSSPESVQPLHSRYVVPLPFQANIRPQYDDALVASKQYITKFASFFAEEGSAEPDQDLVKKIDAVFSQLYDFCDYPQDSIGTNLEAMPIRDQVRYACDANSKCDFVCGLLDEISVDTKMLIIARSPELLRLIHNIAQSLNIDCSASSLGLAPAQTASSAVSLTLAMPNEEFDPSSFNVIIGFDHSFGESAVGRALSEDSGPNHTPLVLLLVCMYSVEHIDAELHENLSPLDRKNAFLSCIVRARQHLMDEYHDSFPEPRSISVHFADYINGTTDTVMWKPVTLPDDIMDIFINSQARSQIPKDDNDEENSRKRKLEDDSDASDEEEPKRMRILPRATIADDEFDQPLPDDVKALLQSVSDDEATAKETRGAVRVPLSILQVLTERFSEQQRQLASGDGTAEYKAAIDRLEARVKDYESTSGKIYKRLRTAIEDRTKFDGDRRKAEEALEKQKTAAEKVEEKHQAKVAELEATIARLTQGEAGAEEESPLARSEKLLKEAEARVDSLTRSLKASQKESELARALYQDASMKAVTARNESTELATQVEELTRKASDTLVAVRKIQAESENKTLLARIRALEADVRERDGDVDRARDELRQVRNARRETRGSSVPRSPRMGMMSPNPRKAYTASASRGTSPAPVPGVEGAVANNGRFNHLRE